MTFLGIKWHFSWLILQFSWLYGQLAVILMHIIVRYIQWSPQALCTHNTQGHYIIYNQYMECFLPILAVYLSTNNLAMLYSHNSHHLCSNHHECFTHTMASRQLARTAPWLYKSSKRLQYKSTISSAMLATAEPKCVKKGNAINYMKV